MDAQDSRSPTGCAEDAVRGKAPELPDLRLALKALADPTRLRIFQLLMSGTHCNCELSDTLGLSLSLISHHLRILRQAGLVDTERSSGDARWVYYSVNRQRLAQLSSELAHVLDVRRIQTRQPSCTPRPRRLR